MTVTAVKAVYPFAELFEVASQGDTVIDLMKIGAGVIIENVVVRVKTPATGSANLIVGDDDDDNGFTVAADATAAEGTVYGATVTERGAYLYDATSKAGHVKVYAAEGKELKFVLSADPTTEGVFEVIVLGHRFALA